MELLLQRETESSEWTQGRLFVDGSFECFTLEDQYQEKKVMHETRIPAGRYEIVLRTFGRHHKDYFKIKALDGLHRGMLWLLNVSGFSDILIHIGNTDNDSSGCILVGQIFDKGKILRSTIAYVNLYKKVIRALDKKEKVFITIKDIKPNG